MGEWQQSWVYRFDSKTQELLVIVNPLNEENTLTVARAGDGNLALTISEYDSGERTIAMPIKEAQRLAAIISDYLASSPKGS